MLHAPGECEYCDGYDDWQRDRERRMINFSGHSDPAKLPCPSTLRRTREVIDRWPGNRAQPM